MIVSTLAAVALGATAPAAPARCTVITGALAHLPTGPAKATVVLLERRVVAVGNEAPPDLVTAKDGATSWQGVPCDTVKAPDGAELTAGLVAAPSLLGLVEVDQEDATRRDDPRLGADAIRASLTVVDGYDPLSTLIPVARTGGLTDAVAVPDGGMIAGRGGFVHLSGGTQAEAVVDSAAVMAAAVPTGSWGEGLRELSDLLADTRTYLKNPNLWDTGRPFVSGAGRADLEAMGAVVRRELPLMVGADAAFQLESLVRWKQQEGVDLVIVGAAEGWKVADQLAAAHVPVLVDPMVYGAGSFDQVLGRPDNPALLQKAGVDVIIADDRLYGARDLRILAGNAVRGGMDHEAALRAVTEAPARVFGQPDRGVLKAGAVADVVLWSGDPLEISTHVITEWIDGAPVSLRTRQTELLEKYRTLPGAPGALPLPASR